MWREKRGEVEPKDLSDNLIVQLGTVTEDLNRRWFERNTGRSVPATRAGRLERAAVCGRPVTVRALRAVFAELPDVPADGQ